MKHDSTTFDLEQVAENVWIMRAYESSETTKYFGVCNIIHHSNGLYEPCAWMIGSKRHPDYLREGCEFLWAKGWELSYRFETHRLLAYKRMFKMAGLGLEIIKKYTKRYNEQDVNLCYGKIVKED